MESINPIFLHRRVITFHLVLDGNTVVGLLLLTNNPLVLIRRKLTCNESDHCGDNVSLEAVKQNSLVFDNRVVHSHKYRDYQSS